MVMMKMITEMAGDDDDDHDDADDHDNGDDDDNEDRG